MKGQPIPYPADQIAWIERTLHQHPTRASHHAAFVARFGRDDVSFTNFAALCKRRGLATGRSGRFHKGQVPPNKGKTGQCAPGSEKGWFRPGTRPHTWRGAGHERIDRKTGYVILIVAEKNPHTGAETRPVQKHRWLWEQINGPVPAGHVLKCLDGDRTNCEPANWVAIPRALLPRLAGKWTVAYDTAPDELKPTLLALAKLQHAARAARRGNRQEAPASCG